MKHILLVSVMMIGCAVAMEEEKGPTQTLQFQSACFSISFAEKNPLSEKNIWSPKKSIRINGFSVEVLEENKEGLGECGLAFSVRFTRQKSGSSVTSEKSQKSPEKESKQPHSQSLPPYEVEKTDLGGARSYSRRSDPVYQKTLPEFYRDLEEHLRSKKPEFYP